jgi:hypothetical protein
VLPFANIGGDPEQDYFVDGVTETLTTDLSRISGAFVIARNTAFTYKGKAADVKQIGRELNVCYVLEGNAARRKPHARQRAARRDGHRRAPLGRTLRQGRRRSLRHARTKSYPASPTGSGRSSPPPKRAAPGARRTRIRWTIISLGWPS